MRRMRQKRLVSKEQYLQHVGKNVALGGVSIAALILGRIGILFCLDIVIQKLFGVNIIYPWSSWLNSVSAPRFVGLVAVFGILLEIGVRTKQTVESTEPVRAVTRHNIDQLPDQESLVRGSEIPPIELQTELLRAVTEGEQTPQEQLLRVAG